MICRFWTTGILTVNVRHMSKRIISANRPAYRLLLNMMRAERESRGFTQQQVAEQLGLPASALAKWERAERRVDVLDLRDYLLACGVDFSEFNARWSKLAGDLESGGNFEVKLSSRPRRDVRPDERINR